MGIDIVSLCVLRAGAIEIPRIDASAHHDLLRVFVVIQTQSPGPATTTSRPLLDRVWTGFFVTFLPHPRHNPSPLNPFRKTPSRAKIFSSPTASVPTNFTKRTQLPLCVLRGSAVLSPVPDYRTNPPSASVCVHLRFPPSVQSAGTHLPFD